VLQKKALSKRWKTRKKGKTLQFAKQAARKKDNPDEVQQFVRKKRPRRVGQAKGERV